jgi:hypothetical protein
MGNDLYDENKRLKRENDILRIQLQDKTNGEAFPKMLESCAWAFFQGRARLSIVKVGATTDVRFLVDPPLAATQKGGE